MIRKLENTDIDDVMEIWKQENIKAHNFIPKEYWEDNYRLVKEALPHAEIYVYLIEERIAGFIGLNSHYIEGIFVDTNYQCGGIGTALLNKAKEDRNHLTLNVYKQNINAINFYQKNGFIITGQNIDKATDETEYTMNWNSDKGDNDR